MKRRGRKSAAQTPAPKSERIKGSGVNKPASASSKASAEKIEFSDKTLTTIKNKVTDYNKTHNNKVSVATAKAVVRRGMGAYSKSFRPTISGGAPNSRVAWGIARLNAFLKLKEGSYDKKSYTQDNDLL
jgi:hypothetical protein